MKTFNPLLGGSIFFILLLSLTSSHAYSELPRGVHALAGTQFDLSTQDLEPLGQMVQRAEIVALGESTHYTAGYFEAKARMIRYLVEQKGFRLILWESPLVWSQAAREFIASCAGDSKSAMYSLFSYVWWDTSIQTLFEWLCRYNQTHPEDPVHFSGMDIQVSGSSADEYKDLGSAPIEIENYLKKTMPQRWQKLLNPLLESCKKNPEIKSCLKTTQKILDDLNRHKKRYLYLSSGFEFDRMKLVILSYSYHQKMLYYFKQFDQTQNMKKLNLAFNARDLGTAQNIEVLRKMYQYPKTIIWAHDWHIAKKTTEWQIPELALTAKSTGEWLSEVYGGRYFPISFVAYQVHFRKQWGDDQTLQDEPTESNALEFKLYNLKTDFLLVDHQKASSLKLNTLHHYLTSMGRAKIIPKDNFSATFYMHESRETDLPF